MRTSTEDIGNARFVGESVKAYYTYKFEGIWQLGQEAEAAEFGQVPGQIRIRDLNGDKKLTNGELRDYLLDNVGRYAQQQQTGIQLRAFPVVRLLAIFQSSKKETRAQHEQRVRQYRPK